jgi:hypothetical protein
MYRADDGTTYEQCERCGRRAEVDDDEDARRWGINHWATYHGG